MLAALERVTGVLYVAITVAPFGQRVQATGRFAAVDGILSSRVRYCAPEGQNDVRAVVTDFGLALRQ